MASLMRRTETVTRAPILSSARRMLEAHGNSPAKFERAVLDDRINMNLRQKAARLGLPIPGVDDDGDDQDGGE